MFPGVELRLFRYVVAVSEELNFGRAAQKCNVAQPCVSKQIKELEEELGTKLFERTKKVVRLTEAGRAFVCEAKEALLHSFRAVHAAKSTKSANVFTLAHCPYVDLAMVSAARRIALSGLPDLRLKLVSAFTGSQLARIRAGEIDAGLVVLPLTATDVTLQPLCCEPLFAVLPANHRLVRGSSVKLRDLIQLPLICVGRQLCPDFHEKIQQIFVEHGLDPALEEVNTFQEAAAMVAGGVGFTLARACEARLSFSGIVFKRIDKTPLSIECGIAFGDRARSDVVGRLISSLTVANKKSSTRAKRAVLGMAA
jgi:DNA-binding transcriptional LysR family regulator